MRNRNKRTTEDDLNSPTAKSESSGWEKFLLSIGITKKDIVIGVSVPVLLFLGGTFFTYLNNQQQQSIADANRKQDLQTSDAQQKNEVLKNYFESMKVLLLDKDHPLRDIEKGGESRNLARIITLTTLRQLSSNKDNQGNNQQEEELKGQGQRKGLVIKFLAESKLIQSTRESNPIISLRTADLKGVYLEGLLPWLQHHCPRGVSPCVVAFKLAPVPPDAKSIPSISESEFNGTDLSYSDLSHANLHNFNLSYTNLSYANLSSINIEGTDIIGSIFRDTDLGGGKFLHFSFRACDLRGADFKDAYLEGGELSDVYLEGANFSNATLFRVKIDMPESKAISQSFLEGENSPLLCNVTLPKSMSINPDRDCDKIPQDLVRRYPKVFPNLKKAQDYVNENRHNK